MNDRTIRILQVVWQMNSGGIENWLMEVLRRIDRRRYQFDFLVEKGPEGYFDKEILSLGSKIFRAPPPTRLRTFSVAFLGCAKGNGYSGVHCHRHHSGIPVLREASRLGIPLRIAHAHSDLRKHSETLASRLRRVIGRRLVRRYCTHGLAASTSAAASLYGSNWQKDSRLRMLPCGIDMLRFQQYPNQLEARDEFGIPHGSPLVTHVGRFADVKNHAFIIEVAERMIRAEPSTKFLLIGDGVLKPKIQELVESKELQDNITFAGHRDDVAALLQASDAFLFPSKHEGLGLAVVEAQAAGLPCVVSDTVPREAKVVTSLVRWLSLNAAPDVWADALLEAVRNPPIPRDEALRVCRASPFAIEKSVTALERLYASAS